MSRQNWGLIKYGPPISLGCVCVCVGVGSQNKPVILKVDKYMETTSGPVPPPRAQQCLLDLFFKFNERRWNAMSPTCLAEGGANLLLPHVGLLVTLPALCGQPVQRLWAHLLYKLM